MKVIDLLQRIANGEEVPKKIKVSSFETGILCKEEDSIDYEVFWKDCDGDEHYYWLFDKPTYNDKLNQTIEILNDEVEVIGEKEKDRKIRKIKVNYSPDIEEKIFYENGDKPNHCILGDAGTELLINKINEIIDYINGGIDEDIRN